MKQSLQLRLGQTLTITPQLQQAIRLLQLSNVELQMEVQQAVESNMMLELDEEEGEATPAEVTAGAEDVEAREEGNNDLDVHTIPDELPVDSAWEDIYDSGISYSRSSDVETIEVENEEIPVQTLANYLLWQLDMSPISETDQVIALTIIDALNDDGFLTCSLEDIRASFGSDMDVGLDEVEAVLHRVQALDPAGIGARDLRECLLLQLRQCPSDTLWLAKAMTLVSDHLGLLAAHDYSHLMRRMNLTRDDLQHVIALIQSMNPRPGGQVQSSPVQYALPDVFVYKHKGVWKVELNSDALPHVRINPYYASLVRRSDSSSDNVSLKAHLQEARWFIKSLQSRNETLLRVATCIVERQRPFLEYGDVAMQPLVLHDVAEALAMHESTMSRVTTNKYMHTPRGIFELKYFFSSHVSTSIGGECSSTAIRALIKKLISSESPGKPLTDSKIAALLSEQGIIVARRTVAKYREAIAIPPSGERKRLA
ncbi:MAG: RNA polymerase factor sigma-54 [Gammaproteobacteria bacterium]|nr:RNA polymerase factor sigma-54 [Gammaproteobacteria bacterium]MCI0590512.1 RNA polymerase factor sigma-54 [Gammaproteobacteria bacterium]